VRKLIAALVAVEVLSELTKLAGRRLAQRRRDLEVLTALSAWCQAFADVGLALGEPKEPT
jgi:hypothetical protein